jgi:hypothetical protein
VHKAKQRFLVPLLYKQLRSTFSSPASSVNLHRPSLHLRSLNKHDLLLVLLVAIRRRVNPLSLPTLTLFLGVFSSDLAKSRAVAGVSEEARVCEKRQELAWYRVGGRLVESLQGSRGKEKNGEKKERQ